MRKTIGFLGCGNMGGAIARAVCKAADPQSVWLANRTPAKAEALAAELGCNTTSNDEVAGRCDLIFLAVKPQMMEELLAPLRFTLAERPGRFVLCTMAAGLSIGRIRRWPAGTTPSSASCPTPRPPSAKACSFSTAGEGVTDEEKAAFVPSWPPQACWTPCRKHLIDAGPLVSGCGPAFADLFMEALADGGVACGLPRDKAQLYAAQMLLGSARLVLESGQPPRRTQGRRVQPRRQHHPRRPGAGRKGDAGRCDGRRPRRLQ